MSPTLFWLLIGGFVFNKTLNYWTPPPPTPPGRKQLCIHGAHETGWQWFINLSVDFGD